MPLRTWTCEWVAACAAVSVESGPSSRSHHLRLEAAQERGSGRLVALQRRMAGDGSSSAAVSCGRLRPLHDRTAPTGLLTTRPAMMSGALPAANSRRQL